jgi:hypothetical protein
MHYNILCSSVAGDAVHSYRRKACYKGGEVKYWFLNVPMSHQNHEGTPYICA